MENGLIGRSLKTHKTNRNIHQNKDANKSSK